MKWQSITLDKIVTSLESGSRPRGGANNCRSGIPSLGAEHLDSNGGFLLDNMKYVPEEHFIGMNRGIIKAHDIVVVKDGSTTGKTSFVNEDFPLKRIAVNEHLFIVRVNKFLALPKYVFYYLYGSAGQIQIKHDLRGATIGGISRQFINKVHIPLPPLSEQRKIVEILDQTDSLLRKRKEVDGKVARILPVLFYKMFGDPGTNPMGWEMKALSEYGAEVRYGLGQPPELCPNGLPLIRATNISKGRIYEDNMLFVNQESVPKNKNAFLKSEEIVVVRSGAYTGDVAQVTVKWEGSIVGYDLVIDPNSKLISEFLEAYLLTSFIQNYYFGKLKSRGGQPHLNAAQLSDTPVPSVPKDKQEFFAAQVRKCRENIHKYEKVDQLIDTLFKNLLHRSFNGQLTSAWRENHCSKLEKELAHQMKAIEKAETYQDANKTRSI